MPGPAGAFEPIASGVDATPSAFLTVGHSAVTGSIGAPPAATTTLSSYLGTDPATQTLNYIGQIAEVLVFDTDAVERVDRRASTSYLSTRYRRCPEPGYFFGRAQTPNS